MEKTNIFKCKPPEVHFTIRGRVPYNKLLNNLACLSRTVEYWPSVVLATTSGQYSTVRLDQARLVSSLLYGTLPLIVKCTSGGLHLKMFVFSIYLWNFGKVSIFLASTDSFNVRNDIIHTFFSLFWLQILNLPASLQNKNTWIGLFPWKRSVLQNPDRERTNQSTGICLRLGLPRNKKIYILSWRKIISIT